MSDRAVQAPGAECHSDAALQTTAAQLLVRVVLAALGQHDEQPADALYISAKAAKPHPLSWRISAPYGRPTFSIASGSSVVLSNAVKKVSNKRHYLCLSVASEPWEQTMAVMDLKAAQPTIASLDGITNSRFQ